MELISLKYLWSAIKLRRSGSCFPQNSTLLVLETREGALNRDTAKNPEKSRPLKSVKRADSWKCGISKMKMRFQKLLLSWKRTLERNISLASEYYYLTMDCQLFYHLIAEILKSNHSRHPSINKSRKYAKWNWDLNSE